MRKSYLPASSKEMSKWKVNFNMVTVGLYHPGGCFKSRKSGPDRFKGSHMLKELFDPGNSSV